MSWIRLACAIATISLAAGLGLGCRTVWVHPEASAEKYADDTFFCKYGIERSQWVAEHRTDVAASSSERAAALAPARGVVNRDWKHCMVRLGWTSTTGMRSEQPWATPGPAVSSRRRR